MKPIDYRLVQVAINYYVPIGFQYIEVPWVVSAKAMNVTVPVQGKKITSDNCFIASGEQGFMQMILDGTLPEGSYCCATPCYRPWDAGKSVEHCTQFFKVELIRYFNKPPNKDSYFAYDAIRNCAFVFMSKAIPNIKEIETEDEPRVECTTYISHDIVTSYGLELGSYGIRSHPAIGSWIYGTGLALPRFSSGKAEAFNL